MKKLLFTMTLMLGMCNSHAQALLRESPKSVTAYLGRIKAKYHTVYDSRHKLAFVVRDMDGGTAVYYFKSNKCISYSIVRHGLCRQDVVYTFDQQYKRDGDVWCDNAQNAYITLVETAGSVYINVLSAYN